MRLLLYIACFATLSCTGSAKAESPQRGPAERADITAETAYDGESPLERWVELGGSGERARDQDIMRSTDHAHSGSHSIRFSVSPASKVAGGNRAEITFDRKEQPGTLGNYGWKLLIPENMPDVPLRDRKGRPNWLVIGQWHQQPRTHKGENWEAFKGIGESAPVAFNYLHLAPDDPDTARFMADARQRKLPGFSDDLVGQSVLVLAAGTPPQTVAIHPINKGTWYTIRTSILWSTDDRGTVQAWVDDQAMLSEPLAGPNMWNEASHYFKLGIYRNPDLTHTTTIYIDDVWMHTGRMPGRRQP